MLRSLILICCLLAPNVFAETDTSGRNLFVDVQEQAVLEPDQAFGLKVVAVSVDMPDKTQAIRDFVAELGLTFDVLHDTTGTIQAVYRTAGVPETFVLDRDGTIRKKWIGPEDWNSPGNKALIERLLAEKE